MLQNAVEYISRCDGKMRIRARIRISAKTSVSISSAIAGNISDTRTSIPISRHIHITMPCKNARQTSLLNVLAAPAGRRFRTSL
jgi:hypothetical protein